jgi:hypothetical protein
MCKLPDGVVNSEIDDLKERIEQFIDHGLRYACRSWHKHFLCTAPAHTLKIIPILHRFLEGKFLFWLEVLSVLGSAREAVDALEGATKWLEVCQVSTLDGFPEFTHTGSRSRQLLTSSMTTFDLSLDSLRSSAYLLCIFTTQPSPYPPKHQLCGDCMNNMLLF